MMHGQKNIKDELVAVYNENTPVCDVRNFI